MRTRESQVFHKLIGVSMRLYRASFLYPWGGKALAKVLSLVTRARTSALVQVNGIHFDLDLREVIDSSLYYSGSFEPKAEKTIASVVRPGSVAIDIGANIGYHTFTLAKLVGPSGVVVAIEPTTYAFNKLQRNLSLNSFPNVRLVKVGLSDRDLGEIQTQFQSSYRLDGHDEIHTETIRVIPLDVLVAEQGLSRVDFIKMDVDGHEAKVFAGARELLIRFRPTIFFEFGPQGVRNNGDDPEALLHLLWALGYHLSTEGGRPTPDLASVLASIPPGPGHINLLATPPLTKPETNGTQEPALEALRCGRG
jgi:FkbM family methyltransferase